MLSYITDWLEQVLIGFISAESGKNLIGIDRVCADRDSLNAAYPAKIPAESLI